MKFRTCFFFKKPFFSFLFLRLPDRPPHFLLCVEAENKKEAVAENEVIFNCLHCSEPCSRSHWNRGHRQQTADNRQHGGRLSAMFTAAKLSQSDLIGLLLWIIHWSIYVTIIRHTLCFLGGRDVTTHRKSVKIIIRKLIIVLLKSLMHLLA